ncbi:MAG: acyltransferase family protein [Pseudobdellovibrionaceae bacterium]
MNTPQSIAERSFYDPAIDGLRGIAILSVVLNHSMYCAAQDPTRIFQFPFLIQIGKSGAGGVSLFFILSALTLMISTQSRFLFESSPKAAFYIRRAFRILPLWWAFIFISFLIRQPSESVIIPHLFMYFGFLPKMNFTHVGWSLFVEETFYLFFPLIFLFLLRPIGAAAFFLMVLLLSGRFFSLNFDQVLPNSMQFLANIPFYHYVTFALGITCFHLTRVHSIQFQKTAASLPTIFWDSVAAISFLTGFISQAHSNYQILAFFIFISVSMINGTMTRRFLSTQILRSFGVCCYSIYLFHGLFLYLIRYTDWFRSLGGSPLSPDFQLLVAFILGAGASYLFGVFSFKYFEKTCVKLGKKTVQFFRLGLI